MNTLDKFIIRNCFQNYPVLRVKHNAYFDNSTLRNYVLDLMTMTMKIKFKTVLVYTLKVINLVC